MQFSVGDIVCRRDDPGVIGTVRSVEEDPLDGFVDVTVRFGTRSKSFEPEQLMLASTRAKGAWECLRAGQLRPARDLRTLLTFERIRRPMGPIGTSFGVARAKLYPYQLKPLLKFLDNPARGMLIADEVGLGKTIEAGYILRELDERLGVDTALILVPARLRTKWKSELERRFAMRFELVNRRTVLRELRRMANANSSPRFRWIASYEALRDPSVVELLEEAGPTLDLLVLDEAHRVRNTRTQQHLLARTLTERSIATLFLTATPVQTSLSDLHTLLDLLQPGAFGRVADFETIIAANRPIIVAAGSAAAGEFAHAAVALEQLGDHHITQSLYVTASVQDLLAELRAAHPAELADRVRLQQAIRELSLTGHLVTRTCKREVFPDRAVRRARTISVPMSATERDVYEAAREVCKLLLPAANSWGRQMATITALRYTASCVWGGYHYMKARLEQEGQWADLREDDDHLADVSTSLDLPGGVGDRLRSRLQRCPDPGEDSKLHALNEVLQEVWRQDAADGFELRKVIVFSFFKRTLGYLEERLGAWGWEHRRIDGDVSIDEREVRVDEFLSDPSVRVLLSSEVGGEGLDMQAASVVVNYDLPWNPMVVEQRIGRVDRIGQRSEVIQIFNLVYEDTIEDRILDRLYRRLGIYEDSVGELDEILGPRNLQQLVLLHISGKLHEPELERRIEDTKVAVERSRRQVERLGRDVDAIVSADQGIHDQLEALIRDGHLPTSVDIADLIDGVVRRFSGSLLDGKAALGVATLHLSTEARRAYSRWSQQGPPVARAFGNRLRTGDVLVTTEGDTALERPRVAFLNTRHPFVQFSVDTMTSSISEDGEAFRAVVHDLAVPEGSWLAVLHTLEWSHPSPTTEIVCSAINLQTHALLVGQNSEPLRRALMREAVADPVHRQVVLDNLDAAASILKRTASRHRRKRKMDLVTAVTRRADRRRATWSGSLGLQVDKAEEHLQRMRERGQPFAIKMAEAKLKRRREQRDALLSELDDVPRLELSVSELAVVLVESVHL